MSVAIDRSEAAILNRLVKPENAELLLGAADFILDLKLPESDLKRLEDLAEKARAGTLTNDEEAELENYRNVGRMLEILKSKARLSKKMFLQAA